MAVVEGEGEARVVREVDSCKLGVRVSARTGLLPIYAARHLPFLHPQSLCPGKKRDLPPFLPERQILSWHPASLVCGNKNCTRLIGVLSRPSLSPQYQVNLSDPLPTFDHCLGAGLTTSPLECSPGRLPLHCIPGSILSPSF